MNPAGGIRKFVESHVPYVEEAIIVDTGSVDGTREILEELESKYSNLKIYDHKFKGFADARNYSLEKVNTKYSLVLDADELITNEAPSDEWGRIFYEMKRRPKKKSFFFEFEHVDPNGNYVSSDSWNDRLFITKKIEFFGDVWETHNYSCIRFNPKWAIAKIIHFLPSEEDCLKKREDWYESFESKIAGNISPSQIESFNSWKAYNSQRERFA